MMRKAWKVMGLPLIAGAMLVVAAGGCSKVDTRACEACAANASKVDAAAQRAEAAANRAEAAAQKADAAAQKAEAVFSKTVRK